MLKLFTAVFEDKSTFAQSREDKSELFEGRSSFTDALHYAKQRGGFQSFQIEDYGVSPKLGRFNVAGVSFEAAHSCYSNPISDYFCLGWQGNDHKGKSIKRVIIVENLKAFPWDFFTVNDAGKVQSIDKNALADISERQVSGIGCNTDEQVFFVDMGTGIFSMNKIPFRLHSFVDILRDRRPILIRGNSEDVKGGDLHFIRRHRERQVLTYTLDDDKKPQETSSVTLTPELAYQIGWNVQNSSPVFMEFD